MPILTSPLEEMCINSLIKSFFVSFFFFLRICEESLESETQTGVRRLTPLSWPNPRSGRAWWESVEPGTCSRRSSCPPRQRQGRLCSLWGTAARWGLAAAARGQPGGADAVPLGW